MSANSKKSMGWMAVLIGLGLIAPFAGEKSLVLLVPAAMVIWYTAKPRLGTGRN